MGGGSRLQVCGPFEIRTHESSLPIRRLRTRKTEWLCAFLGLNRGKWQNRESLIARFWPEDDSNAGRRKLRLALHSIRQELGSVLESEGDKVRLEGLWVDALDLAASQLLDYDFLLGEHEGFLSDLLPSFERRWARELARLLQDSLDQGEKEDLALKLRSLSPRSPEAAAILAEAPGRPKAASSGRDDFGREALLEGLVHHLLGGREPAAAALIGPPGVGKTHLARQLIPLAEEEEVIPLFVSLLGVRTKAELRKAAFNAIASSQGQKGELRVSDLVSTLILFDNADDLEPGAEDVFRELLCDGSPVRLLLTSPENRCDFCRVFRVKPLPLPKEAEKEALLASPAAQFLARRAGVDLTQADPEVIYQACLDSGGLPLALQRCAVELPFLAASGSFQGDKRTSSLHAVADRLKSGWERLSQPLRDALGDLSLLGPKFHPSAAEAMGAAPDLIQQLWESSWLQLSPDGACYEFLPSVLAFTEGKRPGNHCLPVDWKDRLAGLVHTQIASNHTKMAEVFSPSHFLLEKALQEARWPPAETDGSLFAAFYFCQLHKSNLEEAVQFGTKLYGDKPNPAWMDERAVNFLGSAAYFHQEWDLADRAFRHLITSRDPRMKTLGFCNAGLIAQARGRFEEACGLLAESLKSDDLLPRQRAARLNNLAHALAGAGRLDEAEEAARSALTLTQDSAELFEIRALSCTTLGGVCLLQGNGERGVQWAERALASWGEEVQGARKVEAVFLRLCCHSTAGSTGLARIFQESLPRVRQGPPVQAGDWAPFATGLLHYCGQSRSALAVLEGLPWPTTPFWLSSIFGPSPVNWGIDGGIPPSNKERWNLFLESVKHL